VKMYYFLNFITKIIVHEFRDSVNYEVTHGIAQNTIKIIRHKSKMFCFLLIKKFNCVVVVYGWLFSFFSQHEL
jgi:hypothetical protein